MQPHLSATIILFTIATMMFGAVEQSTWFCFGCYPGVPDYRASLLNAMVMIISAIAGFLY